MKYHAPSRRMFLGGAGATLALPLLHSLLPKNAIAATTPLVRYIQVFSAYGASERLFYGSRKGTVTTVSPNVKYQKLTEVQGAISPIFGTEFQSFKSKMTLVRGVDVFARNANHNFCTTTCASSYDAGIDGDHYPPFSGQVSIDALLASSAKVYNVNAPAARRLVALNPGSGDGYTNSRSATWLKTSDGKIAMAAPLKATSAFLDVFASGFGGEGTVDPRENALMSAVWDDYKSVRDSARISSADRRRVDTYMGLISDISRGASTCAMPGQNDEVDQEARIDNQFRLLAATMSCGLTRVASIVLGTSPGTGDRHTLHHHLLDYEYKGEQTVLHSDFINNGKRIARLLSILDSVEEGTGTVLDNSIVYYSMQYGMQIPGVTDGSQHNTSDMAAMVAGGAGGALTQGRYIDYRAPVFINPANGHDFPRLGVPINNLLVTLMNAMGLSSSDYQLAGRDGYGDYPDSIGAKERRADADFWLTTEGKRSALPAFYSGPVRG